MAVFTSLTLEELAPWLAQYRLGRAVELRGIASGIENSNFFLTTTPEGALHEYVLTIFEKLSAAELPFYLDLTAHLKRITNVPSYTGRRMLRLVVTGANRAWRGRFIDEEYTIGAS